MEDGYSGLNYDRPDFQRMLTDIDNSVVNMVITKDLSRLGRDDIALFRHILNDMYAPNLSCKVKSAKVRMLFDSHTSGAIDDRNYEMLMTDIPSEQAALAARLPQIEASLAAKFPLYRLKA